MSELKTKEAFAAFVAQVEGRAGYSRPRAYGIGLAAIDDQGNQLDTWYPLPNYESNYGTAAVFADLVGHLHGSASYTVQRSNLAKVLECFAAFEGDGERHANIDVVKLFAAHGSGVKHNRTQVVISFIGSEGDDDGAKDVPNAYLRLHLLSHRLVLPNTIKAGPSDIMDLLPNVAWTSEGPIALTEIDQRQMAARLSGNPLRVFGVDKLPHMTDYVIPSGVRIADGARVRLGAYVGEGTTVMPSGFINFNAGTLGKAMIEGRVSQGVVIGDGSDLGGGASIQGTMSGGSKVRVSIGKRTLIGALAGVGIALGDDCIVAAGVYVMPSNDIALFGADGKKLRVVKGHELSGESGLLFRRSRNGYLKAVPNTKAVELNPLLHKN